MEADCGFVTGMDDDLPATLDFAGEWDFDFVEILMQGAGHRTELARALEELRERLAANDLDCLVHLPLDGVDVGSLHEGVREGSRAECKRALDVAADLDARKAVLHPTSGARSADARRRLMAEGVREVRAYGADRGVEVCVENLFGEYATVHDFAEVFAETEAPMVFDTGHARVEGFDAADTAAFLAAHRDRVSHLHLNDARKAADEHLPFGAGDIDFEAVFEPLRDGWEGTLSLEVGTRNLDYIGYSKEQLDALL